MIVDALLFAQLAASCAPAVAPKTLAAVASVESGFRAFAIHDNTPGAAQPRASSAAEAVAMARRLLNEGRSVDLGLMQINSGNLSRLGLSVEAAFDPCRSLAAGGAMLQTGYLASLRQAGMQPQPALRAALSRYNTGNAVGGVLNGYVTKVQRAAGWVVPPIEGPGGAEPKKEVEERAKAGAPRCVVMPGPGRPARECGGEAGTSAQGARVLRMPR